MFGFDIMLLGFFATLGGKGAIDTYDGIKQIVTGDDAKKVVNDAIVTVKNAGATVADTVTEGAKDAKNVIVKGAKDVKKVVVEASHKAHETIDKTLSIHPNEHRIGAAGDTVKVAATA